MVKAIIWDNDGVLVDTEELYYSATRDVLHKVGVDLTRDLFIQISLSQGRNAHLYASSSEFDKRTHTRLFEAELRSCYGKRGQ